MNAAKPAGWYGDPSGLPSKFRWWDGQQWTQAMSDSRGAPPPAEAAPVVEQASDEAAESPEVHSGEIGAHV